MSVNQSGESLILNIPREVESRQEGKVGRCVLEIILCLAVGTAVASAGICFNAKKDKAGVAFVVGLFVLVAVYLGSIKCSQLRSETEKRSLLSVGPGRYRSV